MFENFRRVIEGEVGSIAEFSSRGNGALALQAARRIAKEESFGNSALVKRLGAAELLAHAERDVAERLDAIQSNHQEDIREARDAAAAEAVALNNKALANRRELKATEIANTTIRAAQAVLIVVAAFAILVDLLEVNIVWLSWPARLFVYVLGILSACDMFGFPVVTPAFNRIRQFISRTIDRFLRV